MRWYVPVIAAAVALGGIAAYNVVGSGGGAPSAETIARGKMHYATHCAACHGANLEGQPNWRTPNPDGTLPAPPHDASGHTWHHPDDHLFAYTKKGGQALAPAGFKSAMPAFADVLKDDDIRAVLAYIKSTWPKEIRDRHTAMSGG